MRLTLRILLTAVATFFVVLATASGAGAHANLVESSPSDGARLQSGPPEVKLSFSESVSISGDSVRVLDTQGKRVDNGRPKVSNASDGGVVTIELDSDLRPDTYIVAWRVVSADDHAIHGATTFVVGEGARASDETIAGLLGDEGDGVWPALGAIARAIAYAGGLLAIGAVGWFVFVDRAQTNHATRRLAYGATALGAVGLLMSIPVQAALNTGLGVDAATDWSALSDVIAGAIGLGVGLALLGLVAVAAALFVNSSPTRSVPIAMIGAALISVGFARSGHTETTDPRAIMMLADVVHVLVAGAWLGGLVLAARELRQSKRGVVLPGAVAERIARFSAMASIASIATGVAGVVLAWGTVRSLDALTSTTYGRVLLVKVGLVALVGVAAVYNRWWLIPAVKAGDAAARRVLRDTVRIEVFGLLAAVLVTASLVNLQPARLAATPGMFERTLDFAGNTAVVQVDPARAGENALHLYLLDPAGRQLDLPETPTINFRLDSKDIGPITRTPWRVGKGHYVLDGPELSMSGTWTVEIVARVSEFAEETVTIDVPVR